MRALLGVASIVCASMSAGAQQAPAPAIPAGPRSVAGRIERPDPAGDKPVAGVMVTLHRVGPDRSGPLDSLRTGPDGRYAFRYRPVGSEEAIYFVSASYGGIAYFGSPLRSANVAGDDAIITVFDTTSSPIRLRVRGRHLMVSASDPSERRQVLEVFELSNDTTLTRVGARGDSATFRIVLPNGATDFAGGQGDVPPEAIAMVNGRAEVYAPIAPGLKQLSFSYLLPRESFPLSVPVGTPTEVFEVLMEDSTGAVEGGRLVRQGPVQASGRTFVRWLADSVPANGVVRVSFPGTPRAPIIPTYVVAAAGAAALMLFALRFVAQRRVGASSGRVTETVDPERLALRINALDAAFERRRKAAGGEVAPEARAEYDAERARLKQELTDALAARGGRA